MIDPSTSMFSDDPDITITSGEISTRGREDNVCMTLHTPSDQIPDTLTTMHNLALTFRNQGKWMDAESLQVKVMEANKEKLGALHPRTLAAMDNLAVTYRDQGKWKEAENLQVKVSKAMEASKESRAQGVKDTVNLFSPVTAVPNSDPVVYHTQEAKRCLQIMNDELQQDVLGVGVGPTQFLTNAEVIRRWPMKRDENILQELADACTNWAKHLKNADSNNNQLVKELEKFVNRHLLHWIEALSWIDEISSANLSLEVGKEFLESLTPTLSNTLELLLEAQRLISNFGDLIAQAALQIYRSALPLMPNESLLYQKYSREMRNNLCRVLSWRPEDSHGIITRSQQQQPINHIVFSHQPSTYFASWCGQFVNIWNSTTGMSCARLVDERFALADNFSAIASSRESSVFFYNLLDLNTPPTVFTASSPVMRIALSSDGSRLAAGSSNGKIKLWDGVKGSLIQDIDGFECSNQECCHFVFSPNGPAGARLAFSSLYGGLEFRGAIDGKRITNLHYPTAMHFNLAFSSDGSRLASLVKLEKREKHILTVWNVVSGASIGTSAENVGSVLAISANGLLIATGGDGHSLRLYRGGQNCGDPLSFYTPPELNPLGRISCLAFLQDDILVIGFEDADSVLYEVNRHFIVAMIPKHNPSAASFSPDGNRLAIGYPDGTLHLWDTSRFKASSDMSQTKSASVSVLAFSPDCSLLASGFEDGTIRLWDTECQTLPLAIHRSHTARVTALAFRLDGLLYTSGAGDGTIGLWDSSGVGSTDLFHFPTPGELTSLAFSGFVLAAATVYEMILWDVEKGEHGLLCKPGSTLLAFSNPDHEQSRLLASFNRYNHDVTVWDISANRCIAQSQFSNIQAVEEMTFTPDNSQLGGTIRLDDGSETFCLFDLANQVFRYMHPNEYARLFPMPRWQGIPVWLQYSGGSYVITGFFSEDNDQFVDLKMVVLPRDLIVLDSCKRACGSRMFALSNDGRIFLFRSLY